MLRLTEHWFNRIEWFKVYQLFYTVYPWHFLNPPLLLTHTLLQLHVYLIEFTAVVRSDYLRNRLNQTTRVRSSFENPMSAMRPVFQGAQQNRINATEARIFWLALILCPLYWSISFIIALFGLKFKWLLLVCIAIVLNGANLYGYVKCKMGNDKNISAATSDFFRKQVIQNVRLFFQSFRE